MEKVDIYCFNTYEYGGYVRYCFKTYEYGGYMPYCFKTYEYGNVFIVLTRMNIGKVGL